MRVEAHVIAALAVLAEIPMSRYGDPEEIAEAIMYLVAGAPPYLQGHNLVVDGGYVNH